MKNIKTVGVVGAGTMGAAIAQKFSMEGFKVILADRELQFVERGMKNIFNTLMDGVMAKKFTQQYVDETLERILPTDDLNELRNCDLVVEAIFEDLKAKENLFKSLDAIVGIDTILATNTSSFSVNELSNSVSNPERFIGLHYFYHAAKNRLVEIIPCDKTSQDVMDSTKIFCMQSGKDEIICHDSPGFVVNRFFVPWLNEASRIVQQGISNTATVDDVAKKVFGIGMGPFELMNVTGVPIAYHSQKTLEALGTFYKVAELLHQQAESKQLWNTSGEISFDENIRTQISERLLAAVFFVCTQLFDENVCSPADLNRGARIGLKWRKGPVELMKQYDEEEVIRLISKLTQEYNEAMPVSIGDDFWYMDFVELSKEGSVAVITMKRPEDLNALNEEVMHQLHEKFSQANNDSTINTIFFTGTGKAFVAGADIKFFVKNIKAGKICDIETFSSFGQKVYESIANSDKNIVVVINGLALGGGLELALCADEILALKNAQMAFPETGIGIYPGLGGTQRSALKIGKALSKYLIHTGKMLNANEAFEIGLVDAVITVEEMFELFSGNKEIPKAEKPELSEKWKNIEHFFQSNSINDLLTHHFTTNGLKFEEAEKIYTTIRRKAPVAVSVADKLIEEAKGCESELLEMQKVFSTHDALLGLSTIGKKVEFTGA